jgi:hypothetical protein
MQSSYTDEEDKRIIASYNGIERLAQVMLAGEQADQDRQRLLRLAAQFDWPEDLETLIRWVEDDEIAALEDRIAGAAANDDWSTLLRTDGERPHSL